jgi:hypothetical protein
MHLLKNNNNNNNRGAHICILSVPALGLHALIEEEEEE